MSDTHESLGIYLHLAMANERRLRRLERDKMLVLAGVTAAEQGLNPIAAHCRQKIIAHNAGHLVSQYATLAAALEDERFQNYLKQLRRSYPHERVEHMLLEWGIEIASERQAYYNDYEYAASLLGTTPDALDSLYGEQGTHKSGADVRQSTLVAPEAANTAKPSGFSGLQRLWLRIAHPLAVAVLLVTCVAAVAIVMALYLRLQ
jgi:hypothetical protein